jgi:HD-GYP domain-containing protein (c-di-GMP phosphodiesterase class II)
MKLVQIQPESIVMGRPLPYALRTEDGALLANKGFVIQSRPELDRLREKRAIYFDAQSVISRAAAARLNAMLDQDTTLGEIAESTLADLEPLRNSSVVRDSRIDWNSMQLRANWVLRDVNSPEAMLRLEQLHHELSRQVLLHPDASLLALIHLSSTDTGLYSATHALLVSTMCMMAARDVLGWDAEHQQILGKAALTMNFAMTEMQDQLAKQKQPPSSQQKMVIVQHPEISVQMLQQLGVTDSRWLEAVFHHHSVQPGPMKTRDIPLQMARLIQRADVFAARLAPRAARAGMTTPSALQAAYFDEKRQVDEAGAALVKVVGIYPPGSFVKLVNNEVATVIKRGANTTEPKVAVLINKSGIPTGEPIVRSTGLADFRISASLLQCDVKIHFDLDRMLLLV